MRIEYLREYLELANDLSFNRTARNLNMSQSSLSMHMITLERDLETKLISRGTPNSLTTQGKAFIEYATSIVSMYDEAKQSVKSLEAAEIPTLRIHKLPANIKATQTLVRKVFEYRAARPKVNTLLVENALRTTQELLDDNVVDAGIVGGTVVEHQGFIDRLAEQGIECRMIQKDEPAVWLPKTSLLAQKEYVSVDDFEGFSFVFMDHALFRNRKERAESLMKSSGMQCRYLLKSFFSEDDFYMSNFKSNEVVFAQRSLFENNPIVKMRDDMVLKPFENNLQTIFYLGFRKDDSNPYPSDFVEFATRDISE